MELIKILLTSSGGILVISGIGWIIKKLYEAKKSKNKIDKKEGVVNGLRSIAKVYNAMSNLRNCSEIDRVLLVEVSNGGNAPRAGSRIYASAVNVKCENHMSKYILERYDRVRIDDEYINMCISIQSGLVYKMQVNHHDPCLLKDFYTSEGVKYSEVYHIFTDGEDEKMFIMSIATFQDNEAFEREDLRSIIRSEMSFITMEFERFREK